MLGYRFSREFEIRALGYGFLFGNHKHLAKNSGDMWFVDFFLKIFKIHVMIFGYFEQLNVTFGSFFVS